MGREIDRRAASTISIRLRESTTSTSSLRGKIDQSLKIHHALYALVKYLEDTLSNAPKVSMLSKRCRITEDTRRYRHLEGVPMYKGPQKFRSPAYAVAQSSI